MDGPMATRAAATAVTDVLRWSWDFYRRHLLLVVGISLIPALQRFAFVAWGQDMPAGVDVVGELVTAAARLALLAVVYRLAVRADSALTGVDADQAWDRMKAFTRNRWPALAGHVLCLAAVYLVSAVLPGLALRTWVPAADRNLNQAVLLAVKNPTVIAFCMIWTVGVIRQMMLTPVADRTGAE